MSGQFSSGVLKFKAQMSILFEPKCPVVLQVKKRQRPAPIFWRALSSSYACNNFKILNLLTGKKN